MNDPDADADPDPHPDPDPDPDYDSDPVYLQEGGISACAGKPVAAPKRSQRQTAGEDYEHMETCQVRGWVTHTVCWTRALGHVWVYQHMPDARMGHTYDVLDSGSESCMGLSTHGEMPGVSCSHACLRDIPQESGPACPKQTARRHLQLPVSITGTGVMSDLLH